jgi:hypothetical protein
VRLLGGMIQASGESSKQQQSAHKNYDVIREWR